MITTRIDCANKDIQSVSKFHFDSVQLVKQNSFLQNLHEAKIFGKTETSQVLTMIHSFLKSRDDNLILLTTNLLLQMVSHIPFDPEFFQVSLDRTLELVRLDPKLRLVTNLKLSKLYYLLREKMIQNKKTLTKKQVQEVFQFLNTEIANLKKVHGLEPLKKILVLKFKQVAEQFDKELFFEEITAGRMNELSLLNYNFKELSQKDMLYMDF